MRSIYMNKNLEKEILQQNSIRYYMRKPGMGVAPLSGFFIIVILLINKFLYALLFKLSVNKTIHH